jgi:hypothetical protein
LSVRLLLVIVLSVRLLLVIVLSVRLLLVIVLSVRLLLVIVLSVRLLLVIVLSVRLLLTIVLSDLLRFAASDYLFVIFKLFLVHVREITLFIYLGHTCIFIGVPLAKPPNNALISINNLTALFKIQHLIWNVACNRLQFACIIVKKIPDSLKIQNQEYLNTFNGYFLINCNA